MTQKSSPGDRRPLPRKRVLLGGIVTYLSGARSFNCSIKDVSEGGARITLARSQTIPSELYLINVRERTAHQAIVKWNNGGEAGLQFVASFTLGDNSDPNLAYLKQLWIERGGR